MSRIHASPWQNRPALKNAGCLLCLVSGKVVISALMIIVGSVCVDLALTRHNTSDPVDLEQPKYGLYPNCNWGSGIWAGVVALFCAIFGIVVLAKFKKKRSFLILHLVASVIGLFFCFVAMVLSIYWLDIWAKKHQEAEIWNLALINVILDVLLMALAFINVSLFGGSVGFLIFHFLRKGRERHSSSIRYERQGRAAPIVTVTSTPPRLPSPHSVIPSDPPLKKPTPPPAPPKPVFTDGVVMSKTQPPVQRRDDEEHRPTYDTIKDPDTRSYYSDDGEWD